MLGVIAGCGGSEQKAVEAAAAKAGIPVGFELRLNDEGLSPRLRVLSEEITRTGKADFDGVTSAWLELHAPKQAAELRRVLEDLSHGLSAGDPVKFKAAYEERLNASPDGSPMYDASAASLEALLERNAIQCYSGTALNQLLTRMRLNQDQFVAGNQVVILEPGHVLPGFMSRVQDEWHLFGLETTVKGDGLIYFGPAKGLTGPIRVVDANDFAVFEIFKDHLSDPPNTVRQALETASKRYDIRLDQLETKVSTVESGEDGQELLHRTLNASPLAFGTPDGLPASPVARSSAPSRQDRGFGFATPTQLMASGPEFLVRNAETAWTEECLSAGGHIEDSSDGSVKKCTIALQSREWSPFKISLYPGLPHSRPGASPLSMSAAELELRLAASYYCRHGDCFVVRAGDRIVIDVDASWGGRNRSALRRTFGGRWRAGCEQVRIDGTRTETDTAVEHEGQAAGLFVALSSYRIGDSSVPVQEIMEHEYMGLSVPGYVQYDRYENQQILERAFGQATTQEVRPLRSSTEVLSFDRDAVVSAFGLAFNVPEFRSRCGGIRVRKATIERCLRNDGARVSCPQ